MSAAIAILDPSRPKRVLLVASNTGQLQHSGGAAAQLIAEAPGR